MPDSQRPADEAFVLGRLVDQLPAMLAYWGEDQRCRFANRAYERWFGVDPKELVGRHLRDLLGPIYELNVPHIQAALRGEAQEFEREIPDPAGGPPRQSHAFYVPDTVDGTTRGFAVLVTDATRLKRTEEKLAVRERQLAASERLAAMATLAAGVAHEINNPLALVQGHLDLVLESMSTASAENDALRSALRTAREGARRIHEIVESMKLLARDKPGERAVVDVDDVAEKSLAFAANTLRHRARLVRDLGNAGHVRANASQLAQVFVNLLANAAQALPDGEAASNEIRVTTRREGRDAVVLVADNGRGIPEDLRSRIFEPFFTTKDVGTGTGLGLSISSAIVSALGGAITVESAVGEGSVFSVRLPIADVETNVTPTSSRPARATTTIDRSLRVLVVDDEPNLTKMIRRILGDEHDVRVTSSSREAVRLLLGADGPAGEYDLVLCDLMMPELSGEGVYAQVTAARPELARSFVFMTGGAFTDSARGFIDTAVFPVLEKPFEANALRALVAAYAHRLGR
jgi:two-component system, NtrC family, sensor kinase